MYKLDYGVLTYRVGFYAFAVVFTLAFSFGILIYGTFLILDAKDTVKAKVTKIEQITVINENDTISYQNIYHYKVKGIDYQCSEKIEDNDDHDYGTDKVYYKASNPQDCYVEKENNTFFVIFSSAIFIIIGLLFAFTVFYSTIEVLRGAIANTRLLIRLNRLQKTGKLVKDIPYYLKNGKNLKSKENNRIVIDYVLPSGEEKKLISERLTDLKFKSNIDSFIFNKKIDLLIDEEKPNCFYMDFNIDRITGNTKDDYYNEKKKSK